MKKTKFFLTASFIILISMISFADQSVQDTTIPILEDQILNQSIQNSIDEELESGVYNEYRDILYSTEGVEGQLETDNSSDSLKTYSSDDLTINLEKLSTLTVYVISHPYNYDFNSVPVTQMVEDANVQYESIYLDKSNGEKFVVRTKFDGENFSNNIRKYLNQNMYEILTNPENLSEYLSSNGIDSYEDVKFLSYETLKLKALLVLTNREYKLIPFTINLDKFKYRDTKVIDAQKYFDALNKYHDKFVEEQKQYKGEIRLGGSSLYKHQPSLYLTIAFLILLTISLVILKKNKLFFFRH